jgi:hypothetical protein
MRMIPDELELFGVGCDQLQVYIYVYIYIYSLLQSDVHIEV